jgi:hypothetical protein
LEVGDSKATVREKMATTPIGTRRVPGSKGFHDCWTYDLLSGTIVTVCFDENEKLAEIAPY